MTAGIVAAIIFVGTLYLIFSERLNRTIAGLLGAGLMIVAGKILGFYDEGQAFATIDLSTLGLLLGMMIIVSLLEPTGFFEFLAIQAAKISRGKPVRLLILLGSITTILSMFLDNVTTVVLIAPVTILISEIMGLNPAPFLMAEALLSDTGGIATLIGDPPNILIGAAAGLTFNDFLTHSLPIVAVAWITALLLLRVLFRKELGDAPVNMDAIKDLRSQEAFKDKKTARRLLIILAAAVVLFFFESLLHLTPATIAMGAATVALVWVRPDLRKTLERVEWSVLIFFIALFIMIGGLEHTGILGLLANTIVQYMADTPLLFGILLLWVVAGLSAFLDNIPVTIALIPVIQSLASSGMNVAPFWWALAFGAGLGGNGTIIGSTANIIVASLSEKTRHPITAKLWNKKGLPVMLATLVVTTILYIIAFPYFSR